MKKSFGDNKDSTAVPVPSVCLTLFYFFMKIFGVSMEALLESPRIYMDFYGVLWTSTKQ